MRPSNAVRQAWRATRAAAGAVLPLAAVVAALSISPGAALCDAPGAGALGSSVLPPLAVSPNAVATPEAEPAPPPLYPPALSGATAAATPAQDAAALPVAAAERLMAARRETIAAAQRVQKGEHALAAIRHDIALLGRDAEARSRGLADSRAEQESLLGTVLHLARAPSRDGGAADAPLIERLRAEALMREADPALRARLRALNNEVARLAALRQRIAAGNGEEAEARQALAAERDRLAQAVARRNALARDMAPPQSIDDALRLADTEREATGIAELIKHAEAAQEQSRRQPERSRPGKSRGKPALLSSSPFPSEDPTRPGNLRSLARESGLSESDPAPSAGAEQQRAEPGAAPPRPLLVPPVAGTVVARNGDPSAPRTPNDGLTLDAAPGAAIVAPFDGKIVYAGPFREFGRVLIIRHDRRYYSVLAGIGRVDVKLGDWVLAGEPVGALPDVPPVQFGAEAPEGEESNPGRLLYYELRRDGRPVDPQPWLARVGDEQDERNGEQKVSQ